MKKVLAILLILCVAAAVFAGCSKNSGGEATTAPPATTQTPTSEPATATTTALPTTAAPTTGGLPVNPDKVYSENGVDVLSVHAELVGETLNLQVVFSNTNSAEASFDCSKFSIRQFSVTGETAVYKVNATSKTLAANQPYAQYAFTVDDGGAVKEGDDVLIYYGENAIDAVVVTTF